MEEPKILYLAYGINPPETRTPEQLQAAIRAMSDRLNACGFHASLLPQDMVEKLLGKYLKLPAAVL